MRKQRTLKTIISASGIGLHSGRKVAVSLRPAAADTGIRFRRVDLDPPQELAASARSVRDTLLCTVLEDNGVRVATVEHLMAALAGLGIDNAWIDVDGPELPIMDGSAAPFVFLLHSAGIVEQAAPKRYLRIRHPVEVHDRGRFAKIAPFQGFRIDFTIDFSHPAFRKAPQSVRMDFATDSFVRDFSRARTFGFMHEVEALRAKGLALGGSLHNAVVLDEFRVLNPDGLRFPDEFVRHKVLDALGDLYLLGMPLIGAYSGFKSGHHLNNLLARTILETPHAWEIFTPEMDETQALFLPALSPVPAL